MAPWLLIIFKPSWAREGSIELAWMGIELDDCRVGWECLHVWVWRRRSVVKAVHRRYGFMKGVKVGSSCYDFPFLLLLLYISILIQSHSIQTVLPSHSHVTPHKALLVPVRGHLRAPTSPTEFVRLTTPDKLHLADTPYCQGTSLTVCTPLYTLSIIHTLHSFHFTYIHLLLFGYDLTLSCSQ